MIKNSLPKGVILHSLPFYHGLWSASCSALGAFFFISVIVIVDDFFFHSMVRQFYPSDLLGSQNFNEVMQIAKIENLVNGISFGDEKPWIISAATAWREWELFTNYLTYTLGLLAAVGFGFFGHSLIFEDFRARNHVENILWWILAISSGLAILTTLAIVLSVIFESIRFFKMIPIESFLMGTTWNPQFDATERSGSGPVIAEYGAVPLFAGTLMISLIAICVAVPLGLYSAIYLAEYATKASRDFLKPLLEILAGIPTVVYGFFAALTVAPFIRELGIELDLTVSHQSALAAGLVMGVMIIPFVSSLSDDVINAVPQSLRDASYALGSTKSESIRRVVLPAALPGIVAAVILAVSRAIGETMIVVMAAGLAGNLSANPLDAVTTVTAQIVTILMGDQEFESAKTLSAFALALTLITITLGLNFVALQVVKKYREKYD